MPLCDDDDVDDVVGNEWYIQEDQNRGKPNWEHLNEDLHVLISVDDTENRAKLKLARAVDEVKKLLVPTVSMHMWVLLLSRKRGQDIVWFWGGQKTTVLLAIYSIDIIRAKNSLLHCHKVLFGLSDDLEMCYIEWLRYAIIVSIEPHVDICRYFLKRTLQTVCEFACIHC